MPEKIAKIAQSAILDNVFPGCVIGIARSFDSETLVLPFGTLAYDSEKKVTEDTLYDMASVTKSIPLAALAHIYIAQGKLNLTDLVRTYIPELRKDRAATIQDLLLYKVHGEPLSLLAHLSAKEITLRVFEQGFPELRGEPQYSNLPAFLLSIILERITGKGLAEQGDAVLFAPLGMTHTGFFPTAPNSEIAPTEIVDGKEIRGIVHDESARAFASEGIAVGHAGLFSTVPDMLLFIRALLSGKYPEVVGGAQKGLGWQLNQKYFMGKRFGPRTFGKTGFTGASVVSDTDRGIALVILSNRTYPKRPSDSYDIKSAINTFRSDVADIVFNRLS